MSRIRWTIALAAIVAALGTPATAASSTILAGKTPMAAVHTPAAVGHAPLMMCKGRPVSSDDGTPMPACA